MPVCAAFLDDVARQGTVRVERGQGRALTHQESNRTGFMASSKNLTEELGTSGSGWERLGTVEEVPEGWD